MNRQKIVNTNTMFVAILAVVVLFSGFMLPQAANAQPLSDDLSSNLNNSTINDNFDFGSDTNYNGIYGSDYAAGSGSWSILSTLGILGAGVGCFELFGGHGGSGGNGGGSSPSIADTPPTTTTSNPGFADNPGTYFPPTVPGLPLQADTPTVPPIPSNPEAPLAPAPEANTGLAFAALLTAGVLLVAYKKKVAAR